MLVICLDGYDPEFAKDIQWKNRFDIFKTIDTEDHTIPSNCWVITGHSTKIRKYVWDGGQEKLLSHKDLGGPYLWEQIAEKKKSQVWISIPVISPLPEMENAIFIPGILSRPLKYNESEYLKILNQKSYSINDLKRLVDLEFELYLKHKDYDFVFLYVFWLDPANHKGKTKEVKPVIDDWMNKVPLHSKTIVYSDHGKPDGGCGYIGHKPKGILGLKGIKKDISHIKEIHDIILEEI